MHAIESILGQDGDIRNDTREYRTYSESSSLETPTSNFDKYHFDECKGLTGTEKAHFERAVRDVNAKTIEGYNVGVPVEDLCELKPNRTCTVNIPFRSQVERIASGIRSIVAPGNTVERVLSGGPGNCMDWAITMQVVGETMHPENHVRVVPYSLGEQGSNKGFHDHYGITFFTTISAEASTKVRAYAIFGGFMLTDADINAEQNCLFKIKEEMIQNNHFSGTNEQLESKSRQIYGFFKAMQANCGSSPEDSTGYMRNIITGQVTPVENISRLFKRASESNPQLLEELKIAYPNFSYVITQN